MIQKCRQELYPNPNLHVQCWAMMEAAGYSFLDSSANEEICILMQCREHGDLTVAKYVYTCVHTLIHAYAVHVHSYYVDSL